MSFIRNIVTAAALSLSSPSSSDPASMGPPQERRRPASHAGGRGPLWKRPNPPGSGQKITGFDDERERERKRRRQRGF